jgi:hypothetical protein
MKKITTIALVAILTVSFTCLCAYAADNYSKFSSKFKKNFKDCDKYEETTTSEYQGIEFTTHRTIKGWRNSFCQYEETIASAAGTYKLTCGFSPVQVDELYEAMKSRSKEITRYELDTFIEQKDPKTGKPKYLKTGTTTIKGDKAYIAWAKYQNNPYFCRPQKIK